MILGEIKGQGAVGRQTPTLSVVVPTYQESANVPIFFERVKAALDGLPWEMDRRR